MYTYTWTHLFWNWIYGGVTSHEVLSRPLLRHCPEKQRGALRSHMLDGRIESGSHPPGAQGEALGSSAPSSALLPNRSSPAEGTAVSIFTLGTGRSNTGQCLPPPGTVTTATGSGLKPLLCALAPVTAELPEAHLWGTQKGLSREHHPWALSSNQGGFKPQVGVSRVPGYPSRSQRDKGEAGACDKSPTRGREKPGFTPSRRHPLSSQAHPRPGTQRSWSFFWWM